MIWHPPDNENEASPQAPRRAKSGDRYSDYDFNTFRLEFIDVVWAWTFAGCVFLLLLLFL